MALPVLSQSVARSDHGYRAGSSPLPSFPLDLLAECLQGSVIILNDIPPLQSGGALGYEPAHFVSVCQHLSQPFALVLLMVLEPGDTRPDTLFRRLKPPAPHELFNLLFQFGTEYNSHHRLR